MAEEINEFSDDSIAEIAKVVRTLRWRVQNIEELARAVKRARPTHEVRTGVTAARPEGSYPSSPACVLPVQFTDLAFDEPGSANECEALDRSLWPSKFVEARTISGTHIKEGTDVIIVKTSGKLGRRWWIISTEALEIGAIAFECLEDRSRETKSGGTLRIGYADVEITDIQGSVPDAIGDTVEVVFPDHLWLGTVTGCTGWALLVDGEYIVVDCLERAAWIRFRITEDRRGKGSDVDIKAVILKSGGFANAVFPIDCSGVSQDPDVPPNSEPSDQNCGSVRYEWWGEFWRPASGQGDWTCNGTATAPAPTHNPTTEQESPWTDYHFDVPCVCPDQTTDCCDLQDGGGDGYGSGAFSCVTVRSGNEFPRAVNGAVGYAFLDVDYQNTSNNTTMRYYVVMSDQITTRIKGALEVDVCGIDTSVTTAGTVDAWPFSQDVPEGDFPDLFNPDSHAGRAGKLYKAEWNEGSGSYGSQRAGNLRHREGREKTVLSGFSLTATDANGDNIDPESVDAVCFTKSAIKQPIWTELCEVGETVELQKYRKRAAHFVRDPVLNTTTGQIEYPLYEFTAYVTCDDDVDAQRNLAVTPQPVIDECLRADCEANGTFSLEAHFSNYFVLGKVDIGWSACVNIVRCDDGEECAPTVIQSPSQGNIELDEEEDELPPDPSQGGTL